MLASKELELFEAFKERTITIVAAPSDLRKGYKSLERVCSGLAINLWKGNDVVVFVSKSRRLAKIVWSDSFNEYCLSCYPTTGGYQRLLVLASNITGEVPVTVYELQCYLSGNKLQKECAPIEL